ncbi:MAG: uncharacterized protein K0S74_1530 [Chlamydiales bacterium]|nr:uncharacterized protein [Chlamydiales bacterium]
MPPDLITRNFNFTSSKDDNLFGFNKVMSLEQKQSQEIKLTASTIFQDSQNLPVLEMQNKPSKPCNEHFQQITTKGGTLIIDHPFSFPFLDKQKALIRAIKNGNHELIKELLEDPSIDLTVDDYIIIIVAAAKGDSVTFETLLNKIKVDFNGTEYELLLDILDEKPSAAIFQVIIEKTNLDLSFDNSLLLRLASFYGYPNIVQLLLKDNSIDPAAANCEALYNACAIGATSIVQLLLEDGRSNPAINDNILIIEAAERGHYQVVTILMKDPRVNPCARGNQAISQAIAKGHYKVIEILLNDYRVRPTFKDFQIFCQIVGMDYRKLMQLLVNKIEDNTLCTNTQMTANRVFRNKGQNSRTVIFCASPDNNSMSPRLLSYSKNTKIYEAVYSGDTQRLQNLLQKSENLVKYSNIETFCRIKGILPRELFEVLLAVDDVNQSYQPLENSHEINKPCLQKSNASFS